METLKIWKTHKDIVLPSHRTQQSACFDLAFQGLGKNIIYGFTKNNKPVKRIYNGSLTIAPGDRMLVPTGLIMDIPAGYSVRLHARSGMSLQQGLVLANAEGVIDSDYVEEVFVMIHNITDNAVTIKDGDRVAQGELVKNVEFVIEQTPARPLPKTNRMGGFGSTGVSHNEGVVVLNTPPTEKTFGPLSAEPVKRGPGRPKKSAASTS